MTRMPSTELLAMMDTVEAWSIFDVNTGKFHLREDAPSEVIEMDRKIQEFYDEEKFFGSINIVKVAN